MFLKTAHGIEFHNPPPMTMSANSSPKSEINEEDSSEREAILRNLFGDLITAQLAAEQLALVMLRENDIESALRHTWGLVIGDATRTSDHHRPLSKLLACISRLPPATDTEGKQLSVYNLRVWGKFCVGARGGRSSAANVMF